MGMAGRLARYARRAKLFIHFGGREAFIRRYCKRSGIRWEMIKHRRKAIPCDCGDEICEGWAMIPTEDDFLFPPKKKSAAKH